MATRPANQSDSFGLVCRSRIPRNQFLGTRLLRVILPLLFAGFFLATVAFAQSEPHVTAIDPASGKVNDSVTMMGDNLGKESVAAVFLSDDKSDYKATLVEQAADKIVIKVPQVKAGDYNLSIQVGGNILILPVKFKVEE